MLTSWWIPWTVGLKDGLNPGTLMICAFMILACLWMEGRGIKPKNYLIIWFIAACGFNVMFSLGAFAGVLLSNAVQNLILIVHYVFAVFAIAAGVVFFYDWSLLARGKDPVGLFSFRIFQNSQKRQIKGLGFAAIAVGLMTSLIQSIWPSDLFITVMVSNLYVAGRGLATIGLLLMYSLAQLWLPMVLALLFFGISLTPRLRQVISAAVFFAAAASIFYCK